jgi:predicted enzyme related to lactoylglutathione lyase
MAKSNENNGRFVWYEDLAKDPKAAIDFYSDVVGWKTQPFTEGQGDYVMWVSGQGPLGGVMKLPDEAARTGITAHWMAHVQVQNVDTTAALAQRLGGKLHKEPTDIPNVGRFAVIADPQGAFVSIFTPSETMALHDPSKVGEFCWNELMTRDAQAAFKFYSELFGWKSLREMDMGAIGIYRTFGIGDKELGGIMNVPKDSSIAPTWIYYTQVSDLESALTRAKKRGAVVMNGPMEVPGGGRIAQLKDPQGAAFALHQAA